jgi:hypothetical protein
MDSGVTPASHHGSPSPETWIREMDDDAAFMELVLANTQSELAPLERGMHALAFTEKGKHNGRSVDAYARMRATLGARKQRSNSKCGPPR